MLKTSIQRQARLGNVARQFSSIASLRHTRHEPLITLRQTSSLTVLRHLTPRHALFRLYSSESAIAQESREAEFAPVSTAPATRFSELAELGVHDRLVKALTQGMGYDAMTEVQSMSINAALKGTDMVAQAKTGTGKTLAFLVPIFQRVLTDLPDLANRRATRRSSSQDIRAIILSPTRELAEQIGAEARKLAQNTGIVVQTAVGGTRKREALARMWREGCDILVATPGRLNDLLSDPQARVSAPNLQAFVLDEADRMLDVGFADEISQITDMLPDRTKVERQTLLFSATIPRNVVHLAKSMVRPDNFEFVQTIKADDTPTHERVPQHLITVKGFENLLPTILEIAHKAREEVSGLPFKAIVFFSNTATVEYAYGVMRGIPSFRQSGIRTYEIHSRLTQAQRTRSADTFRASESAILFSSDVTARGMDFPNVTHVIQVGLPPDRDQYIHRVGRTGRAGNSGQGYLILAEEEIAEARSRLPALPIKPNNTFESAQHVIGQTPASEEVSRFFEEVEKGYQTQPKSAFRAVYNAMLGQKFGKNFQAADLIGLLNGWCQNAMRWSQPPAITPRVAQLRGLSRVPGIRIGYEDEDEPDMRERDDRFSSKSRFSRNNSFGGSDRFDSRNNDFRGRGRFGSHNASRDRDSFSPRFDNRSGSGYKPRASF
ncbi:DEAD-domain-containing protein [Xylariaceae sp. FL1651]|nr:DEAD-domain-containing protein [Xylariaceae sp. FL1651]